MRAEQDKETSGDHLAMMTSMSGFKFAVSFLFNSATEAMATATLSSFLQVARDTRLLLSNSRRRSEKLESPSRKEFLK